MDNIYEKYSDIIPTLKELDPMHCDLPVVFMPPQQDFHKFCFFQNCEISVTEEAKILSHLLDQEGQTPVFFSDGSADNPDHPDLTKASWALVMYKGHYQQGLDSFSVSRNTMVEYQTQF